MILNLITNEWITHIVICTLSILTHSIISPIPEVSTLKVLLGYFVGNVSAYSYLTLNLQLSFLTTVIRLTCWNLNFITVTILIAVVRRLYFSPLSNYPGPTLAATSKLWAANEYRLGRYGNTLLELHRHFQSDVIRVGPNELSIANVQALEKIYPRGHRKGTFYDLGAIRGDLNVATVSDSYQHGLWRKQWEKALSAKQLKEYSPRIEQHVSIFVGILRATDGVAVNLSKLIDHLVFDIMADITFSHDAHMQKGGNTAYQDFIDNCVRVYGIIGSLRNVVQILRYLPQPSSLKRFDDLGNELYKTRRQLGTVPKDIFTHLHGTDINSQRIFTPGELRSNADLAIVAGTDTTSSCLTRLFCELAQNNHVFSRLRAELDSISAPLSVEKVQNLGYLNAVIYEALRLYPPAQSGIQVTTPSEGVDITFMTPLQHNSSDFKENTTLTKSKITKVNIPGNTQVQVPPLVLMRDPRYFSRPEEFLPERWLDSSTASTTSPDDIKGITVNVLATHSKSAFIPFGFGPHACVGRKLALCEMRMVVASVVREFDLVRGERFDADRFEREGKGFAVYKVGELWVRFVERAGG